MNVKIAVVASGPLIAGEIASIIQSIISESIVIQTYLTCEIKDSSTADIYVCAQTQLKSLSQVVPKEKIVLLDLMPNSKFFISIARIPKNEIVYIFNNHLEYAAILSNYCKNLGITNEFVPIAYREMPQKDVLAQLQKANYIIGVDRFVGEGGLLSPTYSTHLQKDVMIIPATRAASVPSACVLIQCIANKFHRHIADAAEKIKADLQSESPLSEDDLKKLKLEAKHLAISSNQAMDIIQNAVTKSVLNNISSDTALLAPYSNRLDIDQLANQPIDNFLEMIMDSNRTLHLIAKKLASL
ncbi:MAG: hypothetical protein K0Q53_2838 [Massilibacillus sp.]|nr:hypothetical protein [Massilibacillus sp.]